MTAHRVYLRLPHDASLVAKQERGCVLIDVPNTSSLDELCKWLRLTADSLDGKLSASELGHLQEAIESVRSRAFLEAVEICRDYAKNGGGAQVAFMVSQIALRLVEKAEEHSEEAPT